MMGDQILCFQGADAENPLSAMLTVVGQGLAREPERLGARPRGPANQR